MCLITSKIASAQYNLPWAIKTNLGHITGPLWKHPFLNTFINQSISILSNLHSFWRFWKFKILKILISYESFEFFWNLEIFGKFWTIIFFFIIIDFRIWKFYENLEILWNFWKSCFPFEARNGLFPVWVNFHKTLKLFQVMWFNLSHWEVSEI